MYRDRADSAAPAMCYPTFRPGRDSSASCALRIASMRQAAAAPSGDDIVFGCLRLPPGAISTCHMQAAVLRARPAGPACPQNIDACDLEGSQCYQLAGRSGKRRRRSRANRQTGSRMSSVRRAFITCLLPFHRRCFQAAAWNPTVHMLKIRGSVLLSREASALPSRRSTTMPEASPCSASFLEDSRATRRIRTRRTTCESPATGSSPSLADELPMPNA